jgi:16S rRNA (guanine527-N7)-methyltransferase
VNRTRHARPTARSVNERTPGAALRRQPGTHGGRPGPPGRTAPDARLRGERAAELPRDLATLPVLPPSYEAALDEGLAALGLTLPATARAAIDAHVRLLLAWNRAINLTAITAPEAIATRHVADSLTAVRLLTGTGTVLDLGSGGGFPGLPLAAVLPAVRMTLLESVAKKAAFLEVAAAAAGLADRVAVLPARAESIAASRERRQGWDAVVVRGVAELSELVELAMPLLSLGGRLVAWKRGDLAAELDAGTRAAAALGAEEPVVRPALPGHAEAAAQRDRASGLEGHVLVEIRKASPTPPGYPREPAARRSRPW